MHHNQITAFCYRGTEEARKRIAQPFTLNGHTYATDGVWMIRVPEVIAAFPSLIPSADEASDKFSKSVLRHFEFFDGTEILAPLVAMTDIQAEPVIERESVRDGDPINPDDGPIAQWTPSPIFICRSTPIEIRTRRFDARLICFIRQHLPGVAYYDEENPDSGAAMRFAMDGIQTGLDGPVQGCVMPMNQKGATPSLHWNGARYFNGW